MKVMSVAVTVTGVSLVSVFENKKSTAPSNQTFSNFLEEETPERSTPLGYVVSENIIAYLMMHALSCSMWF